MATKPLYVATAVLGIWLALDSPAGAADLPPNAKVQKLIETLGSEDLKERNEADSQLRALPEAIPYLEQALSSPDVLTVRRCRRILAASRKVDIPKALGRAHTYGKAGQIELAIEQLLDLEEMPDNDAFWQAVLDIGNLVRAKAIEVHGKEFKMPFAPADQTVAEFFKKHQLTLNRVSTFELCKPPQQGSFSGCLRADGVRSSKIRGIVISSGRTDSDRVDDSNLLSQDLAGISVAYSSLILSTSPKDHFYPGLYTSDSVIICRGNVKLLKSIKDTILISSGKVIADEKAQYVGNWVIKENEAKPLNFIEWFETRQVGIEASDANTVIEISKLDSAKAFATAGCKVGDQVLSVDYVKIGTIEDFRIAMRKAVIRDGARLTVQRGKETITIKIVLKS